MVYTSTDFNNSTIYIHDEFSSLNNYSMDYIFKIDSVNNNCSSGQITNFDNNFTSLVPNTGKYLIDIVEQNGKKVWHRNTGESKTVQETDKSDTFRIYDGVLQDPMYWNYTSSTINYSKCSIPNEQLVFKNAIFKTITRDKCDKCDKYTKRGIRVLRSNTMLYNIQHYYVNSDLKKIHTIHHPYNGFYIIGKTADVILEKCLVYPLHYETSSGKNESTYDMYLLSSLNTLLKEVTMYEDSHNQMKDSNYWSVMSTTRCKNLVVENSKLNVISAHTAVYNLTVKNTIIGTRGVIVAGSGENKDNKLTLENNTWEYARQLIKIRDDYGTTWNGAILIKNGEIKNASSDTFSIIRLPGISSNTGMYFGQPIYNPTDVTIDGLNVKSSNVAKLQVFDITKKEYEKYYFQTFQHDINKNKNTNIIKNNITGISSDKIKNYSS